ncbi:MAG: type II secretion system protein [Candidatus Buchananbacteria bacterium]
MAAGFTLIELLVSISIIAVMLLVVLASFRTGQRSNELESNLKIINTQLKTLRNMSSAGKIEDTSGDYPTGGYLIHFDFLHQNRSALASAFTAFTSSNASRYLSANLIPNGIQDFSDGKFVQFCGLDSLAIDANTGLPCQKQWKNIKFSASGDFVEIGFNLSGQVIANYSAYTSAQGYKFIGGIFEQNSTKKRAYFYISLISGLVSTGYL